jgi:hypothetical protein
MTDNDFEQLSALEDYYALIVEREHLKGMQHRFFLHHFSVASIERHGDGYRVNLSFWPRRYPNSQWNYELLRGQEGLRNRVAKAGYVLLGYSDKPGDMHLIVSESAKGVQK